MKKLLCGFTILLISFFLTSCTETSTGGTVLGVKGSPFWHTLAPPQDVDAYYDEMATYELCLAWDRILRNSDNSYQIDNRRSEIAQSLQRRGESSLLCSNPAADQKTIADKQIKRAKAETRRAKAEARRACQEAKEAYYSCKRSGGSRCYYPSC